MKNIIRKFLKYVLQQHYLLFAEVVFRLHGILVQIRFQECLALRSD